MRYLISHLIARAAVVLVVGITCSAVLAKEPTDDKRFDRGERLPVPGGEDAIKLSVNNHRIGYRVVQVSATDARGNHSTTDVAIWFPTEDVQQAFTYHYGNNAVQSRVAHNGAVAKGPFPLIVFSHGAAASGISSPFITETLARKGYVVVAPDHTDDVFATRIRPEAMPKNKRGLAVWVIGYSVRVASRLLDKRAVASRPKISYRPAQVRATIDLLLAENTKSDSEFFGRIDEERIGAMGHSFGAWTTMAVVGGISEYKDPRIKAAISLSNAVNKNIFSAEELSNIQVPILIMFGATEVQQGRRDDRVYFYDRLANPKYMLEVDNADHQTFGVGHKKEFANISSYLSRDARRASIVRYVVGFMDLYLKGTSEGAEQLHVQGHGVSRYIYDE